MAVKRGLNMARGLGALIPQGDGNKMKNKAEEAPESSGSAASAIEGKEESAASSEKAAETDAGRKTAAAGKTGNAKSGSTKSGTTKTGTAKKSAGAGKSTANKAAEGIKATANKAAAAKKTSGAKAPAAKKTASSASKAGSAATKNADPDADGTILLRISDVVPNKDQPRTSFEEEQLGELTESIKQFGVITPILVQRKGDFYEIIAGERRWRAARKAGLKKIPAVVRTYSSQEAAEISLIENIQREDLNAIEEAKAYQRLMEEFSMTQEEVSARVARSRSAVANSLRLLSLDPTVQRMVTDGTLTAGHARTLLALDGPLQVEAAKIVVRDALSVRDTEKYVKKLMKPAVPAKKKPENEQLEAVYLDLEHQLSERTGTKVQIQRKRGNKGKIEIEYYSQDDLERIIGMIR